MFIKIKNTVINSDLIITYSLEKEVIRIKDNRGVLGNFEFSDILQSKACFDLLNKVLNVTELS